MSPFTKWLKITRLESNMARRNRINNTNLNKNYTATQKKGQKLLTRHMYSYVFWVAESESEVKMGPFMSSFRHNLKNLIFD